MRDVGKTKFATSNALRWKQKKDLLEKICLDRGSYYVQNLQTSAFIGNEDVGGRIL